MRRSRRVLSEYRIITFKSTPWVTRDLLDQFDISTRGLEERGMDKNFDNHSKLCCELGNGLHHSSRILYSVPSDREIDKDMVSEYLQQINVVKKKKTEVMFNSALEALRNKGVGWIWDARQHIDDPNLIKTVLKRGSHCTILKSDREFWNKLEGGKMAGLQSHNEVYSTDVHPMRTTP
ncbi:hypothetical protein K438DRAFT_1780210 [Mycena galopus ATCC 62051]|nr:hypothetical protein K438DRAFT_1780210 [Mycena galopus ATCC 62051]